MSYNVTGRTNEIGIRMSLGAQPSDILKLVLREILILIGIGLAFGLPSIWAVKSIVAAQLFGISALDPLAISEPRWYWPPSQSWQAMCRRGGRLA
jgi:ABC-type antimicrobial peptide transport system permease subunit